MSVQPVASAAAAPVQDETLRRMESATNYNTWLFERALPYVGRRVLDVGAGVGTFTDRVAPGREVVALEPDDEFAAKLAERFAHNPRVSVVRGRVDELSADSPFDSIICFNVLEHISDDRGTIERFHRLLAPGGALLLLVPAHPRLYGALDRELFHCRRYRRRDVRVLLESASFLPLEVRYVNPIGAIGWLVAARVLRRRVVPAGSLSLFDRLVPLFRLMDRVPVPFGLSVWAIARRY